MPWVDDGERTIGCHSLFERARTLVGEFTVRAQPTDFPLAELMLSDLGFDDLLCGLKTVRAMKLSETLVSASQIAREMSAKHGVSEEAARRILNDIRLGAIEAIDPFTGDPLDALINLNGDHQDGYGYGEMFAVWIKEPHSRQRLIDLLCRSPAAKQLARELVLARNTLVMVPDAWPPSYWSLEDDPVLVGLVPEYDGVEYDLVLLRPKTVNGPGDRIFVTCDGSQRAVPRENDILISLTAQEIASDPSGCATRVLKQLPPPSPRPTSASRG